MDLSRMKKITLCCGIELQCNNVAEACITTAIAAYNEQEMIALYIHCTTIDTTHLL